MISPLGLSLIHILFVHYPSDVLAAMIMGLTMPVSVVLILVRIFGGIYRRRQFGV